MLRRLTVSIVCLLALSAMLSAAAVIELHGSAHLDGERILLGHIAKIAAPEREAEALAEIDLGPAPLPGTSRRLTAGYVKMQMRRSGVPCADLTFTGAEAVRVHRDARKASAAAQRAGGQQADETAEMRVPVEIRRGTRMHLTVARGTVIVGAEATLLENAVLGGRARMRVHQTRETVTAQITGPTAAIIGENEGTSCAY